MDVRRDARCATGRSSRDRRPGRSKPVNSLGTYAVSFAPNRRVIFGDAMDLGLLVDLAITLVWVAAIGFLGWIAYCAMNRPDQLPRDGDRPFGE